MPSLRIGVITDTHASGNERAAALALADHGADVLAFLGDFPSRMGGPEAVQFREIRDGLENLSVFPGPVFVIPGNYEGYSAYTAAFSEASKEHEHLCDASNLTRTFSAKGVVLAFLPGSKYYSTGFKVSREAESGVYAAGKRRLRITDPQDLAKVIQKPDRTVLFVHNPPQLPGIHAIDVALRAVCLGDVELEDHMVHEGTKVVGPLAEILVNKGLAEPLLEHTGNPELGAAVHDLGIKRVVAGDIHEAAGAVNAAGKPVRTGRWVQEFFFNPGPMNRGDFGMVTMRADGFGKVERFTLSGDRPRDYLAPYIR